MPAKGSALKGALAAAPKGRVTSLPVAPRPIPLGKPSPAAGVAAGIAQGAGGGLQRVSPGMYRNPQGQLVNSKGGALPGQRQQQAFRPMPSQQQGVNDALSGVAQNLGSPQTQQPQIPMQPAFRPPMPFGQAQQPGMMYAGGTPNFNEMTGMYNQPATQYPGQDYWKTMQSGFGYGAGNQGMQARQPLSPEQQAYQQTLQQQAMGQASQAQQGIVAPPPGTPNNGNTY